MYTASAENGNLISVCHIASGDRWAGAEAQVATLVKNLSRLPHVRVCAIILTDGRLAHEIREAGIDLIVIPQASSSFLAIYRQACAFLKNKDVHILHSHRYKEDLLALLLHERLGKPRLVRTQHGGPEIASFKRQLVYALHRISAVKVDRVVSVSSQLQAHLATHLKPKQITIIRNGIDLESVHSRLSSEEARKQLGVSPRVPVIGTVARLDPVKRQDLFLECAKEILQQTPEAVFVVAGSGREDARLRQLAQSLGIAGRVMFLGHRDNAYDIIRAMDILLLTSDHEGLPMVVLEAMALGTVVVSRNVGGIPEVITNGSDGVLVDSSDPRSLAASCLNVLGVTSPQSRLGRDASYQRLLAANAHEKVARSFSAVRNAEETVKMYRSILATADAMAPVVATVTIGEDR